MSEKKKIWFFRYDTWQHAYLYLPMTWYAFKRYYELNGKHSDKWEWIPPDADYHGWPIDRIIDQAIEHKADVYMFSSYMWSWDMIKVIANGIKTALPNSIVVIGGPHQHTTYSQPIIWFNEHPYFDAASKPSDYGEFFITDMLDQLAENNLNWNTVRGSYSKKGFGPEGDKRDFKYPTEIIGSNIEHARSLTNLAKATNRMVGIMYETNRGCMYKCTYCEWGGGTNTKVIIKDMDNIRDDVSYWRELDIHTVWITDANFGILNRDPEFAELLCEHTDFLRFVGITGLAKTKAEKRRAVLEPLIKSKLVTLYQISLQTIDDAILENIERTDVPPEENVELARYFIDKYDIDVIVELILGLPGMKVDTFYKETAIEYSLMNNVKPHTHHVPLYVLPDAPVANPAYLEKFKIKLAPIGLEESVELLKDKNSKYVQQFNDRGFRRENTLHIPISSYSYTVDDWKEMFFMNDMNLVLMNMIMITPFIDFLHYHRGVPLDTIFKKLYLAMSSVDSFYKPIKEGYLDKMANGEYWNKSWRQFETGPIKGAWTVHASYAWLWCSNIEPIYKAVRNQFSEYLDDMSNDCLVYCENSTISKEHDVVWTNKWRWDDWEENNKQKISLPVKEEIELYTKAEKINWYDKVNLYRNRCTYRHNSMEKIAMKLYQMTRLGDDHE